MDTGAAGKALRPAQAAVGEQHIPARPELSVLERTPALLEPVAAEAQVDAALAPAPVPVPRGKHIPYRLQAVLRTVHKIS